MEDKSNVEIQEVSPSEKMLIDGKVLIATELHLYSSSLCSTIMTLKNFGI